LSDDGIALIGRSTRPWREHHIALQVLQLVDSSLV